MKNPLTKLPFVGSKDESNSGSEPTTEQQQSQPLDTTTSTTSTGNASLVQNPETADQPPPPSDFSGEPTISVPPTQQEQPQSRSQPQDDNDRNQTQRPGARPIQPPPLPQNPTFRDRIIHETIRLAQNNRVSHPSFMLIPDHELNCMYISFIAAGTNPSLPRYIAFNPSTYTGGVAEEMLNQVKEGGIVLGKMSWKNIPSVLGTAAHDGLVLDPDEFWRSSRARGVGASKADSGTGTTNSSSNIDDDEHEYSDDAEFEGKKEKRDEKPSMLDIPPEKDDTNVSKDPETRHTKAIYSIKPLSPTAAKEEGGEITALRPSSWIPTATLSPPNSSPPTSSKKKKKTTYPEGTTVITMTSKRAAKVKIFNPNIQHTITWLVHPTDPRTTDSNLGPEQQCDFVWKVDVSEEEEGGKFEIKDAVFAREFRVGDRFGGRSGGIGEGWPELRIMRDYVDERRADFLVAAWVGRVWGEVMRSG